MLHSLKGQINLSTCAVLLEARCFDANGVGAVDGKGWTPGWVSHTAPVVWRPDAQLLKYKRSENLKLREGK